MKSFTRIEAASSFFYIVGFFFFALSLGWGWGAMTGAQSPLFIGAFFGIGLLGMFSGFFVQMRFSQLLDKQANEVARYRPVSMDDSFRAFRNYREQAPVFSIADLESQIFAVDSKKTFEIPEGASWILLELWDGDSLHATLGDHHKRLTERELVLIPRRRTQDSELVLALGTDSVVDYCQGIVHFISGKSSLE